MKIRIFAVEIKPNKDIRVSFDVDLPAGDIDMIKINLGKEIEHEEIFED